MLKVLVRKQLAEVFKSYFYDGKKNKMRSKLAIAGWIVFFVVIMVGLLGGIFTFLSLTLCDQLVSADIGWLYFLIMGIIGIMLGAFGSVFNTYASLYLSKDNDLLLSLPIPVRTIIMSRLINVYLMGVMYTATVIIPALAVYWITAGVTAARVFCGILLFLTITLIVLILSCLLGWAVAKISLRLKNKSFVTVLASLVFIGTYYFVYFRASDLIQKLLLNAVVYGVKIKGTAYVLYLFGRIGEGDRFAALIFFAAAVLIFVLIWIVMLRSFLSIASGGGSAERIMYVEKRAREKTVFGALLGKEFGKFTSNANYMLNCGLGTLLIPAGGILLLLKGSTIIEVLNDVFSERAGSTEILICAMLLMLASMNDMAAPSVSLEGKSLWIPQSLPVLPKMVLRAKAAVQLILTAVPMLFASVCAAVILRIPVWEKILVVLMPMLAAGFLSVFAVILGVRMPVLNWTDETAPIKQSGCVMIAMFGCWLITLIFTGLYLWVGYQIGAVWYLLLWVILFTAAALILLHWLDTKGAEIFAAL